ncbi:Cof-type HAD-IIB family hydrolase [Nocardia sp. NBC_01377]|uniref:HAD family hydrolase n=1 Tax=Nocardia sp. NBC_01377 TaxID=2903595 RepID=UPI0032516FD1
MCTGRLFPATLPFLRELHLASGFAVCSNGAVLVDASTGQVVEQVLFDLTTPVAILRERLPGAGFVSENPGVGVRATDRVDDADTHHGTIDLVEIDELAAVPTTRLAVHWPGHSGTALAATLAEIDLPGAIGDSVNDLEMLSWAAHGIAMGNSPAPVLAAADEICPSADEDGSAVALSRWF